MDTLTLNIPPAVALSDEQFYQLCVANEEWRLELTAEGELIIMPPTGGETGIINSDLNAQLGIWNRQSKLGFVFDSSTVFRLPNGARRSQKEREIGTPTWFTRWRNFDAAHLCAVICDIILGMKQVLTLVAQLQLTPLQRQKLEATAKEFASACRFINDEVKASKTDRNAIQSVIYDQVREKFNLTSNHVIRACARVGANRKTAKQKGRKVKDFKSTSFDCDARTFSFRESDWTISVSTTNKRERIKLRASSYNLGKLKDRKPTSAQICLHRDGEWYAHIQIKDEAPKTKQTTNVIGVDFGRREIAKTSTNLGWDGKQIIEVRDKFSRVRASLQKKSSQGTRSTRRRARQILQRLSGRERRFQAWLNHNISKTIIAEAQATNSAVAIEDLSGIRERTNQKPRSKTERRRSNSWAFYQLRQFLEYKGIKEGVEVLAVPPQYTSQTCHRCLHIGLRSAKTFKCANKTCGWVGDADLNGAMNLKHLGAAIVSQPTGSWLSCSINLATGLAEAHAKHAVGCLPPSLIGAYE